MNETTNQAVTQASDAVVTAAQAVSTGAAEVAKTVAEQTPTATDTLKQAAAEVIKQATAGIHEGVNFLSAQIPDVIHQLLVWKMAQSLVQCVIGVVLLLLPLFLYKFLKATWYSTDKKKWDIYSRPGWTYDAWDWHFSVGGFVPGAISTMVGIHFLNITWLQIWLAPKVYLIEYATDLVKSH